MDGALSSALKGERVMCNECKGKGWKWIGLSDNAVREECEPCAGTGVQGSTGLLGICTLAAWVVVLGLVWFSTTYVTQIVN
jgi:hypothetical protein